MTQKVPFSYMVKTDECENKGMILALCIFIADQIC